MPDTVTLVVKESGDTVTSHLYVGENTVAANRTLSADATQGQRDLADDYLAWFDGSGIPLVEEAALAEMGEHLFETWLADDWDDVQDALTPPGRSRFVVASDVPVVLNLPWSLLRLPGWDEPLGLVPTASIRLHPATDPLAERDGERRPGPLRVLYSACAPCDAADLGYEKEEYQLLQTLTQPDANVAHFGCDLGRFDELQDRVREYNPHVVHLTGHGVVADGEAHFAFEDEEGHSDLRPGDQIVRDALAGREVQCVFVSGCETGQAPEVRAVNGLCQGLVRNGVPAAVGWAASILDDVATTFGDTFYAELSAGEDVDRAVVQARRDARNLCRERVDEDGVVDSSWTLPVLYTATTQADLFDPDEEEPPPKPSVAQRPLPSMTEGHAAYFIGRRREQQRLLPKLRSGDLNTVLLTGLGGVGKSTLATRLARRLQPDGFVPIAVPSTDDDPLTPGRLLNRCHEAFLVEDADGPYQQLQSEEIALKTRLRLLVKLLNRNRFTLVLDNFEQNVDRASREILDDTLAWFVPYLVENLTGDGRCLVTSRYRPADLGDDLPPVATEISLRDFPESAFFKYLLGDETVEQRYRVGDLPRDLLRRVYDLLGGTPRFLKQVRDALGEMPADELADALDDVDLPAEADADEKRLQALRDEYVQDLFVDQLYAAIEPPEARTALSRAAVYTIPITAQGFAAAANVDGDTVGDWLDEWRRRTFIAPVQSDDAEGTLWVVPTLLRAWLLDQIDQQERKAAHQAAGNWLTEGKVSRRAEQLGVPPAIVDLKARSHFLGGGLLGKAHEINQLGSSFFSKKGYYREVIQLNREMLEFRERAEYLNWLGNARAGLGEYDLAEQRYESALSVARDSEQDHAIATALGGLATIDKKKGEFDKARDKVARVAEMVDSSDHVTSQARLTRLLAQIDLKQGKRESAEERFKKALRYFRDEGDRSGEASVLNEMASLEMERGNFPDARERFERALEIFREPPRERPGEASVLHQLGSLELSQENLEDAGTRFKESIELNREIGDLNGTASTLHQLGVTEKKKENPRPAADYFIQALQLRQLSEDREGEAMTFGQLGQTAAESFGHREEGLRLLCLSRKFCEEVDHTYRREVEEVTRKIAADSDVDESKLDDLTSQLTEAYRQDRGWSLIQEAFPDADIPEDVPPTTD